MQCIEPETNHPIVCLCKLPAIFPPVLAALYLAGQPLAQSLDTAQVLAVVFLVFKHHTIATGRKRLDAQVYPNCSTALGWHFMLDRDHNGDEPPPCTRG